MVDALRLRLSNLHEHIEDLRKLFCADADAAIAYSDNGQFALAFDTEARCDPQCW